MDTPLHEAFDHGKRISPKLPEGKKNFLIDIDGTICEDIPNEEPDRMATAAALIATRPNAASAPV
ncbi:MAG TPA: hypothetical protein PKL41_06750, partial [Flavobacteriales bacterium]|nr:hypothetical protein [Flavobacteriales bacterium]